MSPDLARLAFSLLCPLIAGYALYIYLFRRVRVSLGLSLAIAYGLGSGILTHWMLLLSVVRIEFGIFWIVLPLLLIAGFFVLLAIGELIEAPQRITRPAQDHCLARWLSRLLIPYLGFILLYVGWRGTHIPLCYWDEVDFIAFKAKAFFHERTILPLAEFPWSSYPLHVPLQQAWTAICLQRWDEQLVKITFPLTYFSYLIIHHQFLSSLKSRAAAWAGVAILVSGNFFTYHATTGYQDLTLMFYNCSAILMLLWWGRSRKSAFLLTAAVFSGLMTFVKLEAILYMLLHIALLLMILSRQKIYSPRSQKHFFKYITVTLAIAAVYHSFKWFTRVPLNAERFDVTWAPDHWMRLWQTLRELASNLFLSGNWNIIWWVLIMSIVLNYEKIERSNETKLLLSMLGLFFGIFAAFALLATPQIWASFNFTNTLSRVILHFYPLAPALIILLTWPSSTSEED